jgi:hypothetical protein
VLIGADGKETVMEITDSEETAKAEAAKLDREAERIYRAEQNIPRNRRGPMTIAQRDRADPRDALR